MSEGVRRFCSLANCRWELVGFCLGLVYAVAMDTKIQDPSKRKIALLAKKSRGNRPRHEIYEAPDGPSRSAYTHFENLNTWPRAATMEKIEGSLGWKPGVVNEVLSSGLEPKSITLSILRGTAEIPEEISVADEQPAASQVGTGGSVADSETSGSQGTTPATPEVSQAPEDALGPDRAPGAESGSGEASDHGHAHARSVRLDPELADFTDFAMLRELALRAAARELDSNF